MKTEYDTAQELAAQKLDLAAANLQHILNLEKDQQTMDGLTYSIEQTLLDARANNPADLCDMIVVQARMLDAIFHHYLAKTQNTDGADVAMESALRAQLQTVRTLNAWKNLKTDRYIVRKLVKIYPSQSPKNHAERTEQNASLDD